jgi:hypothetical protein
LVGYDALDDTERLLHILGYSVGEYGKRLWSKYTLEERQHIRAHRPDWCTISLEEDEYVQAVIGCEELEIIPDHIYTITAYHGAASRYIEFYELQHGPDVRVRIDVKWVLEALHGTGISHEELAVLAAIYSKIGASKVPVRITQDEVWRRALGCKSKAVFEVYTGYHADFWVTKRQVRSIIERLHDRKFFARTTYGRRQTYYTNRMSSTALAKRIFTAKIQRSLATQARRRADAALTKWIQEERRKLAGGNAAEGATDAPL